MRDGARDGEVDGEIFCFDVSRSDLPRMTDAYPCLAASTRYRDYLRYSSVLWTAPAYLYLAARRHGKQPSGAAPSFTIVAQPSSPFHLYVLTRFPTSPPHSSIVS